MPRKPTLSPSKLTTYLACPTKYKWTYVDPRGKWYVRSKSYYSFGTSLHHVLQRFHDNEDTGVTTTDEAIAALEESWIDAGYSSQDEMMQALAEGKDVIQTYVERTAKEPVTAQTVFVEKMFRADLGPFVLIGRIDRIDETEEGTYDIVDYKSGRQSVSEQEVHDDLAMGCYQLILRHQFPDRPLQATIIALRTGDRASASLTEGELQVFTQDLLALGDEILTRDWENHRPTPKALCPRCDFLALCRKDPEFRADYDATIAPTPDQ